MGLGCRMSLVPEKKLGLACSRGESGTPRMLLYTECHHRTNRDLRLSVKWLCGYSAVRDSRD